MNWLWWLLAGILIGWLLSTLIEWLWFRRKRMEVRDARVAELEDALRASTDAEAVPARGTSSLVGMPAGGTLASATGAAASIAAATPDVELTAPDLDADMDMPDMPDMGDLSADIDAAMPDVEMPDMDMPDMPDVDNLSADIDGAMPDMDMPDMDMPDMPDMGDLSADIDAAIPDVEMPDVDMPDMPDMGDLSAGIDAGMPDMDMPDMPDMGDLSADIDATMPDMDMPDMDDLSAGVDAAMPDVEMPDVEMPDVEMPDVEMPDTRGVSAGVGAAAMGVGAAVSAAQMGGEESSDETASLDPAPALPTADLDTAGLSASAAAMITNTNYPDDLTIIKGIGRVYETRLYKAGYFTWDQIANASATELEEHTQAIEAANVEDWAAEAKSLAEANGRVGARYDGPLPDKFSKLKGVGETAEQRLYQAGIFTFAQLAATSPDDLAAIMPNYRGNFIDWVVQAAELI